MSVVKANTGDSLNDYFVDLAGFENMKCHLLEHSGENDNDNMDGFIRWFDKLRILEPRATWLFIKNNQDKFTNDEIKWVENVYKRLFPNGLKDN